MKHPDGAWFAYLSLASLGLLLSAWLLLEDSAGKEFPLMVAAGLACVSGCLSWRRGRFARRLSGEANRLSAPAVASISEQPRLSWRWVLVWGVLAFAAVTEFVGIGWGILSLVLALALDTVMCVREGRSS